MREVVGYIARALVDEPDRVVIEEFRSSRGITYEVRAAPSDVGKLIGRSGRTVKSVRRLVRAVAPSQLGADGDRVEVEVLGEDE